MRHRRIRQALVAGRAGHLRAAFAIAAAAAALSGCGGGSNMFSAPADSDSTPTLSDRFNQLFGSVLFAQAARDAGNHAEVAFAETGTLPWLTRKHGPFEVAITVRAKRLPTGVFPLSRTLDTIGPLAHTVEDCVLIDMALRGQSDAPVRPIDLGGVEFVAPDKTGIDDADAAVEANLETTLNRLAAAGAKVTSRPIPQIGAMRALSAQFGSMVAIEAYAEHRAIFDSADAKRMDRRVVKRALGGRVSERDALNLQRGREELIAALTDELKGAVLVLPATPMTAPAISPLESDDELFRVTNVRAIHYTFLGNLFRMCGLALPSGTDAAGLPTGVQFLAPGGDDDRLLSIGLSLEKALSG